MIVCLQDEKDLAAILRNPLHAGNEAYTWGIRYSFETQGRPVTRKSKAVTDPGFPTDGTPIPEFGPKHTIVHDILTETA